MVEESVRFYRFHQFIRDPIKGALMFIKVYVASFWFALTSIPYTLGTRLFASQTPPCPRESRRREGGAGRWDVKDLKNNSFRAEFKGRAVTWWLFPKGGGRGDLNDDHICIACYVSSLLEVKLPYEPVFACRLVRRLVCHHFLKGEKFHFHAPILAFVAHVCQAII